MDKHPVFSVITGLSHINGQITVPFRKIYYRMIIIRTYTLNIEFDTIFREIPGKGLVTVGMAFIIVGVRPSCLICFKIQNRIAGTAKYESMRFNPCPVLISGMNRAHRLTAGRFDERRDIKVQPAGCRIRPKTSTRPATD